MARQFFRVKLSVLDHVLALNSNDIRAVVSLGKGKFAIWLSRDFEVSAELGKRLAQLGGVTPLSKDCWEVESSDLAELFKAAP